MNITFGFQDTLRDARCKGPDQARKADLRRSTSTHGHEEKVAPGGGSSKRGNDLAKRPPANEVVLEVVLGGGNDLAKRPPTYEIVFEVVFRGGNDLAKRPPTYEVVLEVVFGGGNDLAKRHTTSPHPKRACFG